MKRHSLRWGAVVPLVLLVGCGTPPVPVAGPPVEENRPVLLEATSEASLAELLTKPRAELAALCDEWTARVRLQEKAHREGSAPFALLPDARLPLVLPIWREARFAPRDGISLPPYLAEGNKDSACALHLARFGDTEAAQQLVDPADREARRRIEAGRPERNYPAEWTRLVALMLHLAQYRLAGGDVAGAQELVALHRQLLTVLDPQAAGGPLGADLLARGQHTLRLAARAWREAKNTELADQAEAVLKAWGKVPAPFVAIAPGQARAAAARLLGTAGQGRLAAAPTPNRAFDLLVLPFPDEGVQGVFAFFDGADRLSDVLITYRPRLGERYPEPGQLALAFADHSLAGTDAGRAAGLRGRDYVFDNLSCTVAIIAHSSAAGAWVRFGAARSAGAAAEMSRDLGAAHLQRSFEQNRVRLAPEAAGGAVEVRRPRSLALLRDPLRLAESAKEKPPFVLSAAALQREAKHDVLARLTLRYTMEREGLALPEIARPLWSAYGPGKLEALSDEQGSHVALSWGDATTRYLLRLPNGGETSFTLDIEDRHGADQLARHAEAVAAFDRAERQARLKDGKPLARLPRQVEVAWTTQAVPVTLGMTRQQVLQVLPSVTGVVRQEMPGGMRVLFTGSPARNATHVLRELFLRWDDAGKLAEVRARYEDGPASAGGAWFAAVLNAFRKSGGAAQEQPGSWGAVWSDLPPRKPVPLAYRWQDDVTALTVQRDASGAEVALRDCPLPHPTGLPLPPLEYLPRGPEGVALGDMREGLLRRWPNHQPQADGSVALVPAKAGPYDGILVWFDKGRVVRIAARHSLQNGASPGRPAEAAKALLQEWASAAPQLGWPRRQELAGEGLLQGLSWHDDRTRVRLFWQESNDGTARVFTEWKDVAP